MFTPATAAVSLLPHLESYGNYFLAQALEQTGDLVRAGERYRTVTRLDPFLRSAWLGLQRTEARLDRPESAKQALEVFEQLALNPRSRLAEFRYSRMGPLSMAVLQSTPPVATPSGGLAQAFSSSRQLSSSTFAPDATLQVVDLEGDGVPEIMVAGGAFEDTGARVRVALVVLSEAGINRYARLLVHIEVGNAQDWDVGTSHHAGHLRICTQNWYRQLVPTVARKPAS